MNMDTGYMVAGYNRDFHYRAEASIAKANISEDAYSSSLNNNVMHHYQG
jgi:hypothetical protein